MSEPSISVEAFLLVESLSEWHLRGWLTPNCEFIPADAGSMDLGVTTINGHAAAGLLWLAKNDPDLIAEMQSKEDWEHGGRIRTFLMQKGFTRLADGGGFLEIEGQPSPAQLALAREAAKALKIRSKLRRRK